jgi:phage shock protein PspC (stress-responsive transcriptional regulator)
MNKVTTINLGGNAYQLEEAGYDALRVYLETAAARLQGNPDRDEILSDIEGAIAEKFRALLGARKNVVEMKEVSAVLSEMGPLEAEPGESAQSTSAPEQSGMASEPPKPGATGPAPSGSSSGPARRRLYRIEEGGMFSGVCNGIAAYLNADPTFIRIAFVLLTVFWGTGLLVYIALSFIIPEAESPEEKAAATGSPSTAQEFIRRAKEGYYEGLKHFPDRKARREWKRRFKREMRMHTDHWRSNLRQSWSECSPSRSGLAFVLPFFTLLQGAAMVLWLCAMISLLATGAVLGLTLPTGLSVWSAALILLFVYGIFVGPLKLARRSCYWGTGRPGRSWSTVHLFDSLIWVSVVGVVLWLAFWHTSEVRDAVNGLPAAAHQAAADIHGWWTNR